MISQNVRIRPSQGPRKGQRTDGIGRDEQEQPSQSLKLDATADIGGGLPSSTAKTMNFAHF